MLLPSCLSTLALCKKALILLILKMRIILSVANFYGIRISRFFSKPQYISKVLMFASIFHFCFASNAQEILPVDDSTKRITFEAIVKVDSTPVMTLQAKGEDWMRRNFKSENSTAQSDAISGYIQSEGSFFVYTKGMVSKEIHGAIRFKVSIDVKANKYRYKFYDFVFAYYKQNRQYQYVPTGKVKPLEDKKFPGWEKPWQRYKNETYVKINAYISSLNTAMIYKKPVEEKKPVVKKEQW